MGIEDYVTENSKIIIPALLVGVGWYTIKDGQIFSRDINEMWILVALGGVWWIFSLLRKDLLASANKEKELNERVNKLLAKKPDKQPTEPFEGRPFDLGKGG